MTFISTRERARPRPISARYRRARHRGQALVELALILPVMLFLLLGALDLGRVFYANITVSSGAKEAALRASSGNNDAVAAAVNESQGGFVTVNAGNVTIVYSDATNKCSKTATFGSTVTATVTTPFQAITPYVGAVIGGQTISVSGVATAHCAVLPVAIAIPNPTPTPTSMCTVPNFVGSKKNNAAGTWAGAGFAGAITYNPNPGGNWTIQTQAPAPGSRLCTSSITIGG